MQISDEVRAAVLAEQCETQGHDLVMNNVQTGAGQTGDRVIMTVGCDGNRSPHVVCARCDRTWLVLEHGAIGYDAAEADLIERLGDDDPYAAELSARRTLRLAPAD